MEVVLSQRPREAGVSGSGSSSLAGWRSHHHPASRLSRCRVSEPCIQPWKVHRATCTGLGGRGAPTFRWPSVGPITWPHWQGPWKLWAPRVSRFGGQPPRGMAAPRLPWLPCQQRRKKGIPTSPVNSVLLLGPGFLTPAESTVSLDFRGFLETHSQRY